MHAMDNTTEKRTIQKKNRNYNNTDIYFIFKKLACNYMHYRHRHKEHKQYTTQYLHDEHQVDTLWKHKLFKPT